MKTADRNGALQQGGPTNFEKFWKQFSTSTRFNDLGIDSDYCRHLIEQQDNTTYRSILRAMLVAYGERVGKERVGEKTPSHVRYIPLLLDWFPDARILIMRRDPRAVMASKMKNPWVTRRLSPPSLRDGLLVGHRLYEIAYETNDWAELYGRIAPAWEEEDRVLVVAYEALVKDPRSEVQRICRFLGEAYDPVMLSNRTSETVPEPEGEVSAAHLQEWRERHYAKTLRPISAEGLGKWKDRLTSTEVAVIEGGSKNGMEYYGYDFSRSRIQRGIGKTLYRALYGTGRTETVARSWLRKALHKIRGGARAVNAKLRA
jgi:hypothetical protein